MTFSKLQKIIENNNIPTDVELKSDSGWECGPTDMDGVYYNQSLNEITFTQGETGHYRYDTDEKWKRLEVEIDGGE